MASHDQGDTPMAADEPSHLLKDTAAAADGGKSSKKDRSSKKKKRTDDDDDSDDSTTERDLINVDFEFFDPQDHDFHGIKLLLRQLFDADSQLLNISTLADLIIEQKLVGSTVKVDGREGDPFSFLSVVNWQMHKTAPEIQKLASYLIDRSANTPLESRLKTILSADASENTAIVLSERLLNMPADISPPSYKMLLEEIQLAVEDNEPYTFTHYLLISKVYAEIESKLPTEDDDTSSSKRSKLSSKKSKKSSSAISNQTFNFHPEDDIFLSKLQGPEATAPGATVVYRYKHEPPEGAADAKRAFQDFGILPKGRMILLTREAFESAVEAMQPS
ncbi:hypothetical protein H072_549 [Dactylellina haptotyla CBS 200.50]|uniref:Protein BCP1 n=1 Tax=Dactylellina haptotyla (strain CBS 200.50) TaxID=1284197 RepID=S8AR03_DACHA|nr:hypothetical protein H072_549 [Dactylellina haptotyla CBS 200.50]